MEYPKIALKGGGTLEDGTKVIHKLIDLGGGNHNDLRGYGSGYYYINDYGSITRGMILPTGYKLVQSKQKLFKLI